MNISLLLKLFSNERSIFLLSFQEKLLGILVTVFLGMLITFIVLIILQFVIMLLSLIKRENNSISLSDINNNHIIKQKNINNEIDEEIAAVTVAISLLLKDSSQPYKIKNIQFKENTNWFKAGLYEQLNLIEK